MHTTKVPLSHAAIDLINKEREKKGGKKLESFPECVDRLLGVNNAHK